MLWWIVFTLQLDALMFTRTRMHASPTRTHSARPSQTIVNEAIVNTIQMDGHTHLLSGDTEGKVKVWDLRGGKLVHTTINEDFGRPISHMALLAAVRALCAPFACAGLLWNG
jgi:WD40 repeat protein